MNLRKLKSEIPYTILENVNEPDCVKDPEDESGGHTRYMLIVANSKEDAMKVFIVHYNNREIHNGPGVWFQHKPFVITTNQSHVDTHQEVFKVIQHCGMNV